MRLALLRGGVVPMRLAPALLAASVVVWSWAVAPSDLPSPFPYVATSSSGRFYFKMAPGRDVYGFGAAYAVTASSSQDAELWSVSGWYSFRVFLSDDGRYLVSLFSRTSSPRTEASEPADPFVSFYDNGKLLAQYTIAQLIGDPEAILRDPERKFVQLSSPPHLDATEAVFRIVTGEQVEYTFDIKTGSILKKQSL